MVVVVMVVVVVVMRVFVVGVVAVETTVQVVHVVVVALVVRVQHHVEVARVNARGALARDPHLEAVNVQAGKGGAQAILAGTKVEQGADDHVSADARVALQVQGLAHGNLHIRPRRRTLAANLFRPRAHYRTSSPRLTPTWSIMAAW